LKHCRRSKKLASESRTDSGPSCTAKIYGIASTTESFEFFFDNRRFDNLVPGNAISVHSDRGMAAFTRVSKERRCGSLAYLVALLYVSAFAGEFNFR
jgi:hypothetical protein